MYETAIDAVVQAGIMTGYGNGMFRPDGVLTRYEMSVVLQRVFQLKEMKIVQRILKIYQMTIGRKDM